MLSRPRLPEGVTALSRGTVALAEPALGWLERLDSAVVAGAAALGAEPRSFPPVIDAAHLARIDWFRSFPHLMTVPASLPADEAAVERFVRDYDDDRPLPLHEQAPVEHALLPAACYPVYPDAAGRHLDAPHLVTTRSTCFRRESVFEPLRRQWAFSMREVVCVGTADEVSTILDRGRTLIDALVDVLDLKADRLPATDPFFQPTKQGRHLYQRLSPVKHETVVDDVAIASTNRHHEHFADAFGIERGDDRAHSGCVAFGLERWLGVVAARWGANPDTWPDPREAVLR